VRLVNPNSLKNRRNPAAAMQNRPIITLTTDFGLQDPFVGIMHGVIAGICPSARVIDLTHGVAAFDILDGALSLWQSWRYFPADTIHTVVVDPGVGSERNALLVRMGGHWFIAPDNGVLTLVQRDAVPSGSELRAWKITSPAVMLPAQSHTFHGRDLFSPAAAHLAWHLEHGSIDPAHFGVPVDAITELSIPEPIHHPDGSIEGVILKADKFGNLLTSIPSTALPKDTSKLRILAGDQVIDRFARFFAGGEPGHLVGIPGSSGLLEIAVNRGSALAISGLQAGTTVTLTHKP
jgi:S-adenosylmethionine hydrolase